MHHNHSLFSPDPTAAADYVMAVLTFLNSFHKTLREKQSKGLKKVKWGPPVLPGKHASFTIDRKQRGVANPFDTDANIASTDDEDKTKDGTVPEKEITNKMDGTKNSKPESKKLPNSISETVEVSTERTKELDHIDENSKQNQGLAKEKTEIVLRIPRKKVKLSETIETNTSKKDCDTNSPLRRLPKKRFKVSEIIETDTAKKDCDTDSTLHIFPHRNTQMPTKKQKSSNNLVDKENVKDKFHCLQRRNLFKNDEAASQVLPNGDSKINIKTRQLGNTKTKQSFYSKLREKRLLSTCSKVSNHSDSKISGDDQSMLESTTDPGVVTVSPQCGTSSNGATTHRQTYTAEPSKPSSSGNQERPNLMSPSPVSIDKSKSDDFEIPSSSPVFSTEVSLDTTIDEESMTLEGGSGSPNTGLTVEECEKDFRLLSDNRKTYNTRMTRSNTPRTKSIVVSRECDREVLMLKEVDNILSLKDKEESLQSMVSPSLQAKKRNLCDETTSVRKKLKLSKKKATVQCPLCSCWFQPKVIESHAANCGLSTSPELKANNIKIPEQLSNHDTNSEQSSNSNENFKLLSDDDSIELPSNTDNSIQLPSNTDNSIQLTNDNSVELQSNSHEAQNKGVLQATNISEALCETNKGNKPIELSTYNTNKQLLVNGTELKSFQQVTKLSPSCDSNHLTTKDDGCSSVNATDQTTVEDQSATSEVCLFRQIVSAKSTTTLEKIQESSDSIAEQKRCFICDSSYPDGKLFRVHFRSCRKKYQKLQRQFDGNYNDDETKRKTRSRSTVLTTDTHFTS